MSEKSKPQYNSVIKCLRSVFLLRCPQCSQGDIYPNILSIKPKALCDSCGVRFERDAGVFIMPVFICYFLGVGFAATCGILMGMRYGIFRGFTPVLVIATVIFVLLIYRPVKGLWLWVLWRIGFVKADSPSR